MPERSCLIYSTEKCVKYQRTVPKDSLTEFLLADLKISGPFTRLETFRVNLYMFIIARKIKVKGTKENFGVKVSFSCGQFNSFMWNNTMLLKILLEGLFHPLSSGFPASIAVCCHWLITTGRLLLESCKTGSLWLLLSKDHIQQVLRRDNRSLAHEKIYCFPR